MTRRPTPTLGIALLALASSFTGGALAASGDGPQKLIVLEQRIARLAQTQNEMLGTVNFVRRCLVASEPVSQYADPTTGRTYLDAQHALGQPHLYVMLVKPSCVSKPKTLADLAWRWPAPAKPEGQVSK